MTSLDDTIISKQNLMLLDNVTNYNKPAIDYFHHSFNNDLLELPLSWTLLLKMRKHKLLRLPSCSLEDDIDYNIYLVRLHHCLWRRWSINYYHLNNNKINPLSINWNKDTDVTVLYGPDLSTDNDKNNSGSSSKDHIHAVDFMKTGGGGKDDDEDEETLSDTDSFKYPSSLDSATSSIFDHASCLKKFPSPKKETQKLRFENIVKKRNIESDGFIRESVICINDIYAASTQPEYILTVTNNAHQHQRRRHSSKRHSKRHSSNRNSASSDSIPRNHKVIQEEAEILSDHIADISILDDGIHEKLFRQSLTS